VRHTDDLPTIADFHVVDGARMRAHGDEGPISADPATPLWATIMLWRPMMSAIDARRPARREEPSKPASVAQRIRRARKLGRRV
jgi:hypothetical protein